MHLNRTTRLAPLAWIIYVNRLSIKQLAVVKLWVEPGVRSFRGSDGSDAQKIKPVPSAWEQNFLCVGHCFRWMHVPSSMWNCKCIIQIKFWCTFHLYWIKTIRPWCFTQLFLIIVLELSNSTHTANTHYKHYLHVYISNLRMAWNNCRCYSRAALPNAAHHPQLHLLALPWSIFLTFTPLLLPRLEPLLLLQHSEFPLHVPHLLHWRLKPWGLVSSPP